MHKYTAACLTHNPTHMHRYTALCPTHKPNTQTNTPVSVSSLSGRARCATSQRLRPVPPARPPPRGALTVDGGDSRCAAAGGCCCWCCCSGTQLPASASWEPYAPPPPLLLPAAAAAPLGDSAAAAVTGTGHVSPLSPCCCCCTCPLAAAELLLPSLVRQLPLLLACGAAAAAGACGGGSGPSLSADHTLRCCWLLPPPTGSPTYLRGLPPSLYSMRTTPKLALLLSLTGRLGAFSGPQLCSLPAIATAAGTGAVDRWCRARRPDPEGRGPAAGGRGTP